MDDDIDPFHPMDGFINSLPPSFALRKMIAKNLLNRNGHGNGKQGKIE